MSRAPLVRLAACRRGVAAVEFALAAPILLVLVLGLADFGMATNERMRLTSAARAGAQYAMGNPTDSAGTRQATLAAANGLNSGTVSVTLSCGCNDGSTITCGGTCPTSAPWTYVTVTVAENYALLVTYPGIGNSVALSASASLRTQ
ncbi:MAG: pilus assembly protein [Magnetospirillum sp.]|nr:pilus assembly protein [Magnetospirillum sp.]